MVRSQLFWQLAGTSLVLVIAAAALPSLLGPILGTLVLLAALLLALFGATRLSRRVDQFRQTTQAAVRGQSALPPPTGDHEFAELGRAVYLLGQQVQTMRTELENERR